jgi:hypothetical protein
MTWPNDFTVSLTLLSQIEFNAHCTHNEMDRGLYSVRVTQIHYFEGHPEMGDPARYAINGMAIVGDKIYLVSALVTDAVFEAQRQSPETFVFGLMAAELIPPEWRVNG